MDTLCAIECDVVKQSAGESDLIKYSAGVCDLNTRSASNNYFKQMCVRAPPCSPKGPIDLHAQVATQLRIEVQWKESRTVGGPSGLHHALPSVRAATNAAANTSHTLA